MKIGDVLRHENVDFTKVGSSYFLLGLLTAFDNRFQATADRVMDGISWKQFFAILCIDLCKEPPTLKDLADIMGSSHQNVKQLLLKLEHKGLVECRIDEQDKRKQRVVLTEQWRSFSTGQEAVGREIMEQLFAGIPEEQLLTTIQTILQLEENLQKL